MKSAKTQKEMDKEIVDLYQQLLLTNKSHIERPTSTSTAKCFKQTSLTPQQKLIKKIDSND
jgi:hypothetical protein